MPSTLNLGIVAHVDAGKTTLTERLLFEAGVTTHIGRVDHGDTVTDADAIERQRGITIRSAVVSFPVGDTRVNLIDTPGHSDFVAEVERALAVLDGAVLVVSAVEGVQAQTRVLIRVLEQLGIPFVVFANKIDRVGARHEETIGALREALGTDAIALNRPVAIGSRAATVDAAWGGGFLEELTERLADLDDDVMARYVAGLRSLSEPEARRVLARLTAGCRVHPVYFGSALAGAGVSDLADGVRSYLPPAPEPADDSLHASVFKIERAPEGPRVAFVRLHSGTVGARDHVAYFRRRAGAIEEREGRVTRVSTLRLGTSTSDQPAQAGEIAKVVGLHDLQIGDQLGRWDPARSGRYVAQPGLESVVRARDARDRPALFQAVGQLSEQDPLIAARLEGLDGELTVSLYGEVQKEVLAARLASEFDVDAEFLPTQTVYIERVTGVGEAYREAPSGNATVGLRVEPGPVGSGVRYVLAVERGWLLPSFHTAIEETLGTELEVGLHGWRVTDCLVTLVSSRFSAPTPPAGYFRWLTTVVLREALDRAGAAVCAPVSDFEVDVPTDTTRAVWQKLLASGATPGTPRHGATRCVITGTVPTDQVHSIEQRLADLTRGEGFLITSPAGYEPVQGPAPVRRAYRAPRAGVRPS
jgi:ribosomal protection tetracycline resistance protein